MSRLLRNCGRLGGAGRLRLLNGRSWSRLDRRGLLNRHGIAGEPILLRNCNERTHRSERGGFYQGTGTNIFFHHIYNNTLWADDSQYPR